MGLLVDIYTAIRRRRLVAKHDLLWQLLKENIHLLPPSYNATFDYDEGRYQIYDQDRRFAEPMLIWSIHRHEEIRHADEASAIASVLCDGALEWETLKAAWFSERPVVWS